MARRELSEINAGSMADIAFLLLVFFLVVTTMSTDSGLQRLLPPPVPEIQEKPPKFIDRDVYQVFVNFNNALLVENEYMDVRQLREGARNFLLSNGDNILKTRIAPIDDFPIREPLPKDSIFGEVVRLEAKVKSLNKELLAIDITKNKEAYDKKEKSIKDTQSLLDKTLAKKYAFEFFGNYAPLPGSAMISVKNDNSTNYETYVLVNNELEGALNDLRNEVSEAKFGTPYNLLNQEDDEDKKKILAIREVYPQRISEAEPEDVKGFITK